MAFLLIVTFRAIKIVSTLRADIPVTFRATNTWKAQSFPSTIGVDKKSFQSYQNSIHSGS